MPTRRGKNESTSAARPPATTPEGRENQLVALAVDLAEKQIRDGTASSQVISHFLKLGTVREQLEREKLKAEIALSNAKVENLASSGKLEELASQAIAAFRSYSGNQVLDDGDYDA